MNDQTLRQISSNHADTEHIQYLTRYPYFTDVLLNTFGHILYAQVICEVTITVTYVMFSVSSPLLGLGHMTRTDASSPPYVFTRSG